MNPYGIDGCRCWLAEDGCENTPCDRHKGRWIPNATCPHHGEATPAVPVPDAVLEDEECTRCGVRQGHLSLCDDCYRDEWCDRQRGGDGHAVPRGRHDSVWINDTVVGGPDSGSGGHIPPYPPPPASVPVTLSPGVLWCSWMCGWSVPYAPDAHKLLIAHLRTTHRTTEEQERQCHSVSQRGPKRRGSLFRVLKRSLTSLRGMRKRRR